MRVYYNDNNPDCAEWLRGLINAGLLPAGDVDERDIRDVRADDVASYAQCHFFAGIGGWPLALQIAGYSEVPCWTGSCPCQPFSAAGKRVGFADDRHLWPEWLRLIRERRPAIVFGEQVARASAWLALVHRDLESLAYAVGCMPVEAACVGARHRRERFWFVADTREPRLSLSEQEVIRAARRRQEGRATSQSDRWPAEPGVVRVAHGVPGRVAQIRALGNAIVPQCAAIFIESYFATREVAP